MNPRTPNLATVEVMPFMSETTRLPRPALPGCGIGKMLESRRIVNERLRPSPVGIAKLLFAPQAEFATSTSRSLSLTSPELREFVGN